MKTMTVKEAIANYETARGNRIAGRGTIHAQLVAVARIKEALIRK